MRYASIDILRTIALFVMVLVHFGENLSGYAPPFAGLGAPLFALLSGVSYRLWSTAQEQRGKSETEISKISNRRGLFVFGVGMLFNVVVWLPEDTFNWDVLTFIGVALILLNLVRRLPLPVVSAMAVAVLFVSPLMRVLAEYDAYWVNGYFDPDLTLQDVLVGFLATGYFPIFPWLAFSLIGFVTGSLMFAKHNKPARRWRCAVIGAGLIAVSAVSLLTNSYLSDAIANDMLGGWTMFPPTTSYVLGTLGMALLLLGVLHQRIDCNPRADLYQGWLDIAKTFSRNAFTIYVLHHIVHLWPLWIYGLATGNEATFYWMKAMPATISLPLALLFMVLCYFYFRWIGPSRNYGIERVMRWLCD